MKHKYLFYGFLFSLVFVLLVGCGGDEKSEENYCVKCGAVATSRLSGSADSMQKNGIPLDSCEVTEAHGYSSSSNIYTAYLCDSCMETTGNITHSISPNF